MKPTGIALLISQLGGRVSTEFARRVAEVGLTPPQVAVLRVVGQNPGLSQRDLADRLGNAPSRVVQLVDELEERGIITRTRSTTDRRNYELTISETAPPEVARVREIVRDHDAALVASLTHDEIAELQRLLQKLASTYSV